MKRVVLGLFALLACLLFPQCNMLYIGIPKSSEKAITAFRFEDPSSEGSIDESSHSISVTVPPGTKLEALAPTIEHSGVSVSPASSQEQDFSSPVTYKVTAENGSTQDYVVTVTAAADYEKRITAFSFTSPAAVGEIDEANHAIALTVPYGTNVTALSPTIEFIGAGVSPASGAARNFTDPVTYTVTAADNSTQGYVVTVTEAEPSGNNNLASLTSVPSVTLNPGFSSGSTSYTATVPFNVSRITFTGVPEDSTATLEGDSGKSVELAAGSATAIHIIVTAQNGQPKTYTVTVTRASEPVSGSKIIDHQYARLAVLGSIPNSAITAIRNNLHVAYGHTSHGSQVTDGMSGLAGWSNAPGDPGRYAWNNGGSGDALDLRDTPFSGASDLGNPNRTAWAAATRTYLDSNPDVNVVMWSWCGQADTTEENIELYLSLMTELEEDYPEVAFIYMTGHLVGSGEDGNLHLRNQQIREYCRANDKWLYDFADIESYDPEDTSPNYMVLMANDNCDYDSDGNGSRDRNWATDWQNSHGPAGGVYWYSCSAAHSRPLNANLKAYAAWYLFARLAGWDGTE